MKLQLNDKYKFRADLWHVFTLFETETEAYGYLSKEPNTYTLHRLDGYAWIGNGNKLYYIDGIKIDENDFKRHPEVRKEKLKRILYGKD